MCLFVLFVTNRASCTFQDYPVGHIAGPGTQMTSDHRGGVWGSATQALSLLCPLPGASEMSSAQASASPAANHGRTIGVSRGMWPFQPMRRSMICKFAVQLLYTFLLLLLRSLASEMGKTADLHWVLVPFPSAASTDQVASDESKRCCAEGRTSCTRPDVHNFCVWSISSMLLLSTLYTFYHSSRGWHLSLPSCGCHCYRFSAAHTSCSANSCTLRIDDP
jgi:hypothetical protein